MNWHSSLGEARGLWRTASDVRLSPANRVKYMMSYYFSRPGLASVAPTHLNLALPSSGRRVLKVSLRPNGGDHHTFRDVFQRRLYAVDATDVRHVLDLGANIGLSTLFFALQFPDAEFACVEPSTDNCKILRAVLARNDINAVVIQSAIGPVFGAAELHLTSDASSYSLVPAIPSARRERVMQVTVPAVLERLGWNDVDVLKVDIEGYERKLFSQNNAWLTCVKRIVGEAHGHVGYGIDQVRADLAPFGFHVLFKSYDTRYALTVFEGRRVAGAFSGRQGRAHS